MTVTKEDILAIRDRSDDEAMTALCTLALRALDFEADAALGAAVRAQIGDPATGGSTIGDIEWWSTMHEERGSKNAARFFRAIAAHLRSEVKP